MYTSVYVSIYRLPPTVYHVYVFMYVCMYVYVCARAADYMCAVEFVAARARV